MKKQVITPTMIMEATIHYVAAYGLETTTTKKIATSMGISEGTIFNNFPNKPTLFSECLYYIDKQIDPLLKLTPMELLHPSQAIHDLWFRYFNFLLEHGDYAKYYRQYRQSSYYDANVVAGQDSSYSLFVKLIHQNSHFFKFNPDFYWVFIIETTLNFAVRIIDGNLPGTPKDIERIYGLISHGFIGNMHFGKKET